MRAYVDISDYWPNDESGQPASVNSVYVRFIATDNRLTYQTLLLAKNGRLTSSKVANLLKLARVCSELIGRKVGVQDLIKEKSDQ